MATIKGKWVFNEKLNIPEAVCDYHILNYKSNGGDFVEMYISNADLYGYDVVQYVPYAGSDGYEVYRWSNFPNQDYRTIDFGATEQTVSDTFLTWMQANATPEAEPTPTDAVTIEYNGSVIASLKAGQTAQLHVTEKGMESDIVITAH